MSGLRVISADGSLAPVTLHDPTIGVYQQMRYAPATPETRTVTTEDPYRDGDPIPVATYQNVTETAEIFIIAAPDTATAVKTALDLLFQQARTYQRYRRGPRVFVEYRPTNTASWRRSEVLVGRAAVAENIHDTHMLEAGALQLLVHWTRRPYWEGPETALSLTNPHGSGGSVPVFNTTDATRANYATVTSAVLGTLPSPLILSYTNTAGSTMNRLFAGLAATSSGVAPGDLVLDSHEASYAASAVGGDTGGGYSGSSMIRWNQLGPSVVARWSLPPAMLTAARGCPFKVLVRVMDAVETQLRCDLLIFDVSPIATGTWQRALAGGRQILEGPTITLPPYLQGLALSMQGLSLALLMRTTSGQFQRLDFDAIHLLPAEGYRVYEAAGYGAQPGITLVDDGVAEQVYTSGWGSGVLGNFIAHGEPMLLQPGRTHRVHVLAEDDSGRAFADRTGTISAAYRPRYLTF